MNPVVEKTIQKQLSLGKSPSSIAKQLLGKKTLSKDTRAFLDICRFMHRAGLYKLLIQTAISRLEKKQTAPWVLMVSILEEAKVYLSKEDKAYFVKGIIEQKQTTHLPMRKNVVGGLFADSKLMRPIEKIEEKQKQEFTKLMEDLHFISAQGILKKEEEILKKLKKIDPENPRIQEKWRQFREKWGSDVIRQKKRLGLKIHPIDSAPSKTEKKQAESVAKAVKKILKSAPEKTYDMALLFSFIGHPYPATQILKDQLNNISSKWLYLELLLQSKLYLDCLSFSDIMEAQHSENPETIFGLTYIRAKAYYGLGQHQKAKEMLKDLLKIRPQYRLTHHLLKEWEKGESSVE